MRPLPMAGLAVQGHELGVVSPGSSAKGDGALGSSGACLTVSDVLGAVGERTRGAEVAGSSRSEGSMGRRESGPMMACMTQLGRVGRQRGPHRSESFYVYLGSQIVSICSDSGGSGSVYHLTGCLKHMHPAEGIRSIVDDRGALERRPKPVVLLSQ